MCVQSYNVTGVIVVIGVVNVMIDNFVVLLICYHNYYMVIFLCSVH